MENSRTIHPPVQNHHHSGPHHGLETIQRQASHSSPYHVHPYPPPVPVQQAFQSQEANMFHPKGLRPYQDTREGPVLGRALCLTSKDSPVPGRVSHLNEKFQDSVTMYSDTDELVARISSMFPTVSHTHIRILLKKYYNREAVVISALQVEKHPIATPGPLTMSPSAARLHMGVAESLAAMYPAYSGSSESGRFSPRQEIMQAASAYYRGARPRHPEQQATNRQSSPKMKLKYLKSVFPKADETFILEVLAKNDNNVQMAGQDLEAMGYVKKDKMQQKKKEPTPQPVKKVVLMRTIEDRQIVLEKLQRKYWSVPEKLIMMALEAVEYNEERAENILSMMLQEHSSPPVRSEVETSARLLELPSEARLPTERRAPTPPGSHAPAPAAYAVVPAYMPATVAVPGDGHVQVLVPVHLHVPVYAPAHVSGHASMPVHPHAAAFIPAYAVMPVHAQSAGGVHAHAHPLNHAHAAASAPPPAPDAGRQKMWNDPKPIVTTNVQPEVNNYQTLYSNVAAGPNPAMRHGPQDNLLLEDYMPWNGPNPELRMGQAVRPVGALEQQSNQFTLARGPSGLARGPSGLAQGPSGVAQGPTGIAQGSMYRNRN